MKYMRLILIVCADVGTQLAMSILPLFNFVHLQNRKVFSPNQIVRKKMKKKKKKK